MAPNQTAASRHFAPSSNNDPLKPKRARMSKPKVKTGCSQCKRRRIKCDEKRPSCSQCLRSNYECKGYPAPPRSAPFEEIRIAPKPMDKNASLVSAAIIAQGGLAPRPIAQRVPVPPQTVVRYYGRNTPPRTPIIPNDPSVNMPFSHHESLYFQVFREHTANELSGFFDSIFWNQTVLRECHAEDAIRHAVVALGALYKTMEKSSESPPSSPSDELVSMDSAWRHWEVAITQYSHACNLVVQNSMQGRDTHRTSLMASVLLACFDSFIGHHKQAIRQIQNGLTLLEQLRRERRQAFMSKPEEPVEDELIQMFTRLAIQAKSYDMAFHFPQPYVIYLIPPNPDDPSSPPSDPGSPVSIHQQPIPDRFSSLIEARIAWDTLCEKIFRFTETMFNHVHLRGPPNILPHSVAKYGEEFRQQIQAWSNAFEHILHSRTAPGVSFQEKAGIAVLKMFQIMGQILFLMTFKEQESQFDSFMPHFRAIVDYASEVVGDEERRAAAKRCPDPWMCQHRHISGPDIFGGYEYAACHIKPSFSADLGIVPPLYVVATKCRHPVIRRQAIQLLRSSARREGMWDSELTARIAMWITEIEEEGDDEAVLTPGPSPIPSRPSTGNTGAGAGRPAHGSVDLSQDIPLGPGGNARWSRHRQSQVLEATGEPLIPESKRIMIKAAEFDLREHKAIIRCGTRGLAADVVDRKVRIKHIMW